MDAYDRDNSDRTTVKTSFVALPVAHGGKAWTTAGELREPLEGASGGAVVIVHGSAGVDSRGATYAAALNAAGLATLEIDLWAARGVTSPAERPRAVSDTLPDAFAALAFLAARQGIDRARIGVMGFSWGGVVSMLTATAAANAAFGVPGLAFAAHAPIYPVCWLYNRVPGFEFAELTGAPVLIQAGAQDLYDDPDTAERLVAALPGAAAAVVRQITYPGAGHAWDRREPDVVINDPTAHKGAGGEVPFRSDAETTRQSVAAVLEHFRPLTGAP
jgi:dienelactone hydrolase